MEEFGERTTYGEKYGPAMAEDMDESQAAAYFERLVAHTMKYRPCERAEAEMIERQNLGYWAGYYDHATRLRVERLFACQHPIFGSAQDGVPSPEDAFEAGEKAAKLWVI